PVALTVAKGTTTTALSTSAPSVPAGQELTLTAVVAAPKPGTAALTGTVNFSDGGQPLGSASLVNGVATLKVSTLAAGSHALSAAYAGDTYYAASASPSVNQQVAPTTSGVSVTLSGPSQPATYGQPVTLNAHVAGATPRGSVQFKIGA